MKEYTVQLSDKGTVSVDDTILVKGVQAAAGSRILEGFEPLFSAEAVTRLEEKGYVISGKTQVGEFGLDLVGEFSYYGTQEGTLKGAAAELVAQGEVKAALGVDMTGAPRRAAALSGVDFLKPTYGTVSRYGIISCASSVEYVTDTYTSWCMHERNRRLVNESQVCIAYMTESRGGTAFTFNYALQKGLEVINVAEE